MVTFFGQYNSNASADKCAHVRRSMKDCAISIFRRTNSEPPNETALNQQSNDVQSINVT